jgi:coiled-coil domain-containing protein 130
MQGFNMGRYVPPELEGTVSFNAASGKGHALGNRARKLKTEGILTVRFECPFAIWCTHCSPEQIIGQGVRFNAEKKKVGNYFSTPIWSFRFKHTVCGGWLEVRTDPKNAEYLVVEGGRRRDTGVDKLLDGEVRVGVSEEDKDRLEKDGGFGVLEKKVEDKSLFNAQKARLDDLLKASDRDWADPYEVSKRLRADFRVGRRKRQADEISGEALREKFGIEVDLLPERPEDSDRVKYIDFGLRAEASSSSASASSSKPLFQTLQEKLPSRLKVDSVTAATAASKKLVLQNELRTNTRMATDPFLRDPDPWQPRVKRKRDPTEEQEQGLVLERDKVAKVEGMALVGYDSDSSS